MFHCDWNSIENRGTPDCTLELADIPRVTKSIRDLISHISSPPLLIEDSFHASDAQAIKISIRDIPKIANHPRRSIQEVRNRSTNGIMNSVSRQGSTAAAPAKKVRV
jgi:hypothetical protein